MSIGKVENCSTYGVQLVAARVGFAMPRLIHHSGSSRLLKPETDDCIHSVLVLGHPRRAGVATAAARWHRHTPHIAISNFRNR